MRSTYIFLAGLMLMSFFSSCEKEEGEGGDGSIVGKVFKVIDDGAIYCNNSAFNSNSKEAEELLSIINSNNLVLSKLYGKKAPSSSDLESLMVESSSYIRKVNRKFHFGKDTIVGCDEDVFIVYGNHDFGCDDKVNTSFDGSYRFNYLNDGKYKIFACNDNADGKEPVAFDVYVDGGQVYGGDFYLNDGKNANLCGVIGYLEASFKGMDFIPGVDQRVYIREENGVLVDDCRVDDNGFYSFAKLKPNTIYQVWSITEPQKNEGLFPYVKKFKTSDAGTIVPGPVLQSEVN